MRSTENAQNVTRFTKFFGPCDLEIWHMTLQIWDSQAVGISNHLIKHHGNGWWNVLAKAGTDGWTKAFMDMLAAAKTPHTTMTTPHDTEQVT